MRVDLYAGQGDDNHAVSRTDDIVRAEVPLVAPDDSQYKIILLDADDSFDVIIHHPNGDRECVWSLVKGPE